MAIDITGKNSFLLSSSEAVGTILIRTNFETWRTNQDKRKLIVLVSRKIGEDGILYISGDVYEKEYTGQEEFFNHLKANGEDPYPHGHEEGISVLFAKSAFQMQTELTCPLRYGYEDILRNTYYIGADRFITKEVKETRWWFRLDVVTQQERFAYGYYLRKDLRPARMIVSTSNFKIIE